ncbi:MAG TPA: DNA polymerase III subunit delta, partial [Novosphingobium sp.]|nr:DNA polymerase III subunit delta [Novosphingobium sp.]
GAGPRRTGVGGAPRHIWVRASGEEAHDALEVHLAGSPDACPVLVIASGATDKSRTAKLLAPRPDALVAMFYPPDMSDIASMVRQMGDAAGLRIGGDLATRIARGCGMDTRLARSEIDKLALFLDASPQAPRALTAEALDALGASTEDDGFAPLVNAVLAGEGRKVPLELRRMRELGMNPVGLLLAFERRAAQLAQLAPLVGKGRDIKSVLDAERVFFKDHRDLTVQLQKWRSRKLERLLAKLMDLHRALLADSRNAELLLAQGLAEIARAASPRG